MRRLVLTLLVAGIGALPQVLFAQRAQKSADEWLKILEAPARLQRVKAPDVVAARKLTPGMTVADIGAGTGIFSLPMALAIKPDGVVYAVDLTREAVDYIEERATEQGLVNVKVAVGTATDPNMPVNVDLALLHDSLRYIEQRPEYLKMLAEYLMPGGRIAVIEYKPEAYPDRADPSLTVTEEEATAWATAAGLKVVEKVTTFPDRWFVVFGK
jgi:ubiquinone/menaquinone biosynthesis C-methylase UbiE